MLEKRSHYTLFFGGYSLETITVKVLQGLSNVMKKCKLQIWLAKNSFVQRDMVLILRLIVLF